MFRINPRLSGLVAVLIAGWLLSMNAAHSSGAKGSHGKPSTGDNWTLVWSDEFNGPDGSLPDAAKWHQIQGGSGFGNGELEYYTGLPANIHQDNGNLVITAKKEDYKGPDGLSHPYTSARIETKGRFQQKYGRMEARIKIPKGQGIWPAFWMMGNNFDTVGWPDCGEIDIMENVGFEPSSVHGTLHGPGYSGGEPLTGTFTLPQQAHFSDNFHVFAIEWDPQEIRFYVDNTVFETQSVKNLPAGKHWAFDHPFFILLNVAIGGYWPGNPDGTTAFPTSMLVDYVRVYRPKSTTDTASHP
ncbi:glycoside hydrolase family 16 protein [Terracidiphilus gabretensis]|jgi:beta-glucanase (GH16 family)|uniref:glycoside hydrolase family 16 protein n=1 Tax=Terracidiphilus gabretensis TaxID=1577687 RepID=UPI00071B2302|nr:glycoside hydrolase family 16 protein [Terracidiphilus gabretensis]